jgi:tetratricopeptide (TPR) repeat protein
MISMLVLLAVISFLGFIWQVYVLKGGKTKGRRRSVSNGNGGGGGGGGVSTGGKQKRETDTRLLSPPDKKIYLQAQELLNSGRPPQAAQLLESIQMQREAITILENAGLIHEAARILMRMGKHNRAGVVYARHGYWERAADSFKMADMPLEVAKCSKESGNFAMAAEYFLKANRAGDAGRMYMEAGDHRNAAKYLAEGQEVELAIKEYRILFEENKSGSLVFGTSELKLMTQWLVAGNYDRDIARIIASTNRVKELIMSFAKQGKSEEGAEAYRTAKEDLSPALLGEVDYENPVMWETMAKIFILNGLFEMAGVIFEKKSLFERAAVAFEKAENRDRAIFCYKRAGLSEKASGLRGQGMPHPLTSQPPTFQKKTAKAFSMTVLPEFGQPDSFGDEEVKKKDFRAFAAAGESTRILEPSVPPPPLSNSAAKLRPDVDDEEAYHLETDDSLEADDDEAESAGSWKVSELEDEDSEDGTLYEGGESVGFSDDIPWKAPVFPPRSSNLQILIEANEDLDDESENTVVLPNLAKEIATRASRRVIDLPEVIQEVEPGRSLKSEPPKTASTKDEVIDSPGIGQNTSRPREASGDFDLGERIMTADLGRDDGYQIDIPIYSGLGKADDEPVANAFTQASFIADLSDREKEKLWRIGSTRHYTKGGLIVNYNDEPDGVYIILAGKVDCYRAVDRVDQFLDTMGSSETFGELWLLTGHPTAVKFVSRESCDIRVIQRDHFNNLLDQDGSIARKVYKRFTSRLLTRLLRPQNTRKNSIAS